MTGLTVYKANSLIDASYKLNAQAQKLILCCLAKLDSRGGIPKEITLSAVEFSELVGVDLKNAHRELYKAADHLFEAEMCIKEGNTVSRVWWVQKAVTKHGGAGAITLTWSDDVIQYISELQDRFTGYKVRNIALLKSPHSIRLYEILMKWKATGERTVYLDDFKAALGITGKYREFKIFNRDVLKKAVKELNSRSDLVVSYEPIRQGRKVTALAFNFKSNV